jgi:hypothetical protein
LKISWHCPFKFNFLRGENNNMVTFLRSENNLR